MRVVIPVKSFRLAKHRLADTLSPLQRERLAMLMATNVVAAANGYDIAIACDDNDVEKWARDLGADVIRTDGRDLNGSISLALADSRDSGWDGVAIVHSDLPLADSLDAVFDHFTGQVVLVPDVAMDGTNVMVVPTDRPIAFAYGPGSLARHISAVREAGLTHRLVESLELGWDIDEPEDLSVPIRSRSAAERVSVYFDEGLLIERPTSERAPR